MHQLPIIDAGSTQTITKGQSVTLNGKGGGSYSWLPSTDLKNPNSANPTADPASSTTYTMTVTDVNSCVSSDTITVFVKDLICPDIVIPTAFSPNGDGQNDLLVVKGGCIQTFDLVIFDRWGNKVFESINQANSWDGLYQGSIANSAVFAYILKATLMTGEDVLKKGNITLLK